MQEAQANVASSNEGDDKVEQTDNGPRPQDGPQDDVPQDPDVIVSSDVDDNDEDLAAGGVDQ